MTKTDYKQLKNFLVSFAKYHGKTHMVNHFHIHSAWEKQIITVWENYPFCQSVSQITKEQWDIRNPSPFPTFDCLMFNNVFHYIEDPEVALKNVLEAARVVIIQDLIDRSRGENNGLGTDGDAMRYHFKKKSSFPGAFDLYEWLHKYKLPFVGNVYQDEDSPESFHFITYIQNPKFL